ncbi:MAG: extensin family protein [Sphingomonadales bacterium]|nr:MAG: extensin family protein [Sphingomonadales bacterium]
MYGSKRPELETPSPVRRAALAAGLVAGMMLSACSGDMIPAHKGARKPAVPPPAYHAQSAEYRQCTVKLASLNARYTPLPDKSYGGGCSAYGAVRLDNIGVLTTNLGPMTCPLAENFAAWARYGVAPAAQLILGSDLVRIETFGTYNCRPIAGSGKLSEHAHSNAVDVAAFLLADGRRISVQGDWNGDRTSREFLRRIRESACKRFRTVLSPDYNAAHHDHLHFDMGGKGTYCR